MVDLQAIRDEDYETSRPETINWAEGVDWLRVNQSFRTALLAGSERES